MAQQNLGLGTAANDGTGDPIRTALQKVQDNFTDLYTNKLNAAGAVISVAGLVGAITASALKTALSLVKGDIGLGNVDNTSDAGKPVSTAQAAAIAASSRISSVVLRTFASTGTYTPTAGMVFATVECTGGGGAGGGAVSASGSSHTGGGGGAGSRSVKRVTAADIGASKTVTIGAAGTASAGADGSAGGDTSVGSLCIGKGGSGGIAGANALSFGNGGSGGVAGAGDIASPGAPGGAGGIGSTSIFTPAGFGGCSMYGAGGKALLTGGGATGNSATGFGAGGGGGFGYNATTPIAGGSGAAGYVVITEYIGV
ncbi:hypothetical protein [Tardiphaga sp.]|uniref:glycine-rich domain-containing protein n=1 Tax=Tardiphaga sp. TaxID=1926292 RepID=UPI002621C86B|nr:hypothetical protein [Tardiphaga sp.]MDB5618476.1 hypothetical protein [Tardiphaga sp.]